MNIETILASKWSKRSAVLLIAVCLFALIPILVGEY